MSWIFFSFDFKTTFLLASVVLNIKMFFRPQITFFFLSQQMQSSYTWLKYCSYSFFTILSSHGVYSLLSAFLEQIGLGKHPKRTMLHRDEHVHIDLIVKFPVLLFGGTL